MSILSGSTWYSLLLMQPLEMGAVAVSLGLLLAVGFISVVVEVGSIWAVLHWQLCGTCECWAVVVRSSFLCEAVGCKQRGDVVLEAVQTYGAVVTLNTTCCCFRFCYAGC